MFFFDFKLCFWNIFFSLYEKFCVFFIFGFLISVFVNIVEFFINVILFCIEFNNIWFIFVFLDIVFFYGLSELMKYEYR